MPSASENLQPLDAAEDTNDDAQLRDSLKRCSPATIQAALSYRASKDPALIPTVVLGIIARFLEPDAATRLAQHDDDLRVIEDLGLDSLTLMEAIILIEESLQISIKNEELRYLRTVGDIKVFIDHKARGLEPPQPSRYLAVEAIAAILPQQPPFLFLRDATISAGSASGTYQITGSEAFLAGHFKDNPVFPASILLESLGQLAVLHLLQSGNEQIGGTVDPKTIFFTGCDAVRCHRICRPGDVLKLNVRPKRLRMPMATFEGSIRVGQEKTVTAGEINLTFGYTIPSAPTSSEVPEEAQV